MAPLGDVHWAVDGGAADGGDDPLLSAEAVARAVDAALTHGGRPEREVDVVFVDDARLASMHAEFLGDPSETDVITFDLGVDDGPGPDAELYVSVDRARRVAAERGVSVERELALYVVHGALHLVGFDDKEDSERARMREAERTVLSALGYPEDTAPHDA